MSDLDYKMLLEQFARLRDECTTAEKATRQLQSEGILDEDGNFAVQYRDPIECLV